MRTQRSFRYNDETYLLDIEFGFNCMFVRIKAILGQTIHCYQYMAYETKGLMTVNDTFNQVHGFDTMVDYPKTLEFCVDTSVFRSVDSALNWLFTEVRPYVCTKPIHGLTNLKRKGMSNYWAFVSDAIVNSK